MSEKEATMKSKKFRSPNYPFIGLEEAINKADLILKNGGLHEVPFEAAMQAWDYKTGSTQQTIAALRGFGLVTVSGAGLKRKVQLTESARKILKPDHPERPGLLKEAVLMPTIYGDLWKKFSGDLPPSDSVISNYLEFDRKFNPDVIKGVIKDFRASISFANLSQSDKIENDGGDNTGINDDPPEDDSTIKKGETKTPTIPVLKKDVVFNITIDVLDDGQITVVNGGELTSTTMKLLQEVFNIKERHELPKDTEIEKSEIEVDSGGS